MADNILNLPRLAKSATFKAASDKGNWKPAEGTLERLGRSLPLPDPAFDDPDEPIRAIPDPWAQPRAFGEAVLDESHSMHSRALPQWRGLLALFALQDLHSNNYHLAAKPVSLAGGHIMERVLSHLLPQVAVDGCTQLWGQPWLFQIDGETMPKARTIAMANPICLVSPGRNSLHGLNIPGVGWAEQGLSDPLASKTALPVPELAALTAWLAALQTDLRATSGNITGQDLLARVGDYLSACRAKLGKAKISASVSDSTETKLPPLFRPLWRSAKADSAQKPWETAQTKLRLDPDIELGNVKGLLLVDAAIGDLPGFDPGNTFVWGTRTLAEMLASETLYKEVRSAARNEGWWIVKSDDLFTDRAVTLGKKGEATAVAPGNPEGLKDAIIPLRPIALMLEGGRNAIKGRKQDNQLSVTLQLAIEDADGNATSLALSRNYSANPGADDKLLVPRAEWDMIAVSMWPDFAAKEWENYSARIIYPEDRKKNAVLPRTAWSSEMIAREVRAKESGGEAVTELDKLNRGQTFAEKPKGFLRSQRGYEALFEELQYSSNPFDGVLYTDQSGDRPAAEVGMVFHKPKPVEATVIGEPSIVAVDFGTTNTVACINDDKPVTFKKRLAYLIETSSSDLNRAQLSADNIQLVLKRFMPYREQKTPTPTVAFTRIAYPESSNVPYFAFRNFIYFHGDADVARNGEAQAMEKLISAATQFRFGLKWREEPGHVDAARDFLEQFMTLVAAETINKGRDPRKISWRFSIPDSLQTRPREAFQANLSRITSAISSELDESRGDPPPLEDLKSEGLAAAHHILLKAGATNADLNIVMDIGGGTTDITIWKRETLIWQGSLRLAGMNFFTRYFTSNPVLLGEIGLPQWQKQLEALPAPRNTAPDGEAEDRDYLTELLFSSPQLNQAIDQYWENRLILHVGDGLRQAGLVMLAGMAWYVGLVTRKLLADGAITPEELERQAVGLCGRGAGLFKRIHGRKPTANSAVSRALSLFSVAARLQTPNRPQVFSSNDEKLEVVRGMMDENALIDQSVETGRNAALTFMPAALQLETSGGGVINETDLIRDGMLDGKIKTVSMAEFDAFVAALKSHAGINLDLLKGNDQGARQWIENGVRQKLDRERSEKGPDYCPEPPFISALRILTATMTAPEEIRHQRFKAKFE